MCFGVYFLNMPVIQLLPGLTWFEEHDGLEAGELGGVNGESLEAAEGFLQEAQVQAGVAGLSLHAWAEIGQREQRAAVQRQRPLDGTQQEELAPRLLQQDHLVGYTNTEPLISAFFSRSVSLQGEDRSALLFCDLDI